MTDTERRIDGPRREPRSFAPRAAGPTEGTGPQEGGGAGSTGIDSWPGRVKRIIDLVGATAVLIVVAPVMAVTVLAIRIESTGPTIFRQTRLGRDRRPFTVYKFRSMRVDADPEIHRLYLIQQDDIHSASPANHYKVGRDGRVTRVGAVIRRLSIDELPQLVNVLKGEMSLVGPRPDMPYSLENYQPHHFRRFDVPPGLTGLWQVSGRSRLSYRQMLDLDVTYADTWSLMGDLKLLVRTVPGLLALDRAG